MERTKTVRFRCSEDEYEKLKKAAGSIGLSKYLRRLAGLELAVREDVERHADDLRELAKPDRVETTQNLQKIIDSVPPFETTRYRCPRDCDPTWRPQSPVVRCPHCRRTVEPA